MNITRSLLILLFLLAGLIGWLFFRQGDDATTLAGQDRAFAVDNVNDIRKIFLADREGNTTTLARNGDTWQYNGQWQANPDAMRNLLDAIARIRIKYKPPEAMLPTMVRSLATRGIKVELYGSNDRLLKAYYVGGATPDERGTYIMMEGADQPYVGELANWEGNLRFRYSLTGDEWRDKTVFSVPMEDIQEVAIAYPRQQSESFRIRRSDQGFEVRPYYPGGPAEPVEVPRGKAEAFLNHFKFLGAEAFENENPVRDSILQLVPFSTVELQRTDGSRKVVRFFPVRNPGSGPLPAGQAVRRYFADVDGADFMLVQHRVFQLIFWSYDAFLPDPT